MNFAKPPVISDSLTNVFSSGSGLTPALSATSASLLNPLLQPSRQTASGASAIAFIDASVTDYQTLVADIAPGTEVHLLDSSQDAVTQITNTLLGRHNISSLHIVSHGEAGGLDFGTGKLNLTDLPEYAAQLQSWSKALTDGADILLYGCDVAQGELGKAFTSILSQLTGADVAASDDLTGASAKGGNWTLEYQTGSIEAGLAFSQSVRESYSYILPSFTVASSVAVGTGPYSVAIGDFNGDGKADFATVNNSSNNVSIRLGNGMGGFSGTTNVAVGTGPYSVAIGDFNGDGKADFATANLGSNTVSVRLGNGMGGFSGGTDVTVGSLPFSVAIGDFNGDGKADFAAASYDDNTVSVRLGNGTGGFSGTTNVAVGFNPFSVAVGDFNGDGKADFATANISSNTVSIRLGDGTGGFSSTTDVNVGSDPYSVAIGDFNGDGKADFATANYNSGTVSVRLGDGLGGFSGSTTVAVGSNPYSVAIGDFNGDGKADFATANGSDTVSVRLGNGMGGFSGTTNVAVGSGPVSVAIGDFNGDGKADFATTNNGSNTVSVLLNTSPKITVAAGIAPAEIGTTGTFTLTLDQPAPAGGLTVNFTPSGTATRPADYSLSTGSNITSVSANSFVIAAGATTATLNVVPVNDGIVDPNETVILTLAAGNDYFLGSNATAQFAATSPVAVGTQPLSVAIGDLNGDGKADFVAANYGSNTVSVRLGDGLGGFSGTTNVAVGGNPNSVAIGDFNGDGKADLAVANESTNNVSVLLGTGSGSFGAATNFTVGANPAFVAIGDFNGDGKADLAVANESTNNVSVLLGTGSGSFGAATNFTVGTNPRSVAIGDFNGDGKADLATANRGSNNVSVLLGIGNGSFGAATNFTVGANPRSVAIGDFNGDGKADLATPNFDSNNVSVLLGTGSGSFGAATNFTVGTGPYSVAIGDFNGDGKADLAAANIVSNNVSVLLGTGSGSFGAATNFTVGAAPFSVAIRDFNGDGKADIAAANRDTNNVSVLLNTAPSATLVIADNAAPVVILPSTAVTYTENATPSLLDASATVTDDSPNFNTGTLTVGFSAGGTVSDRLTIIPNGTVTLDGRRVLVSGTEIGTYRGGIGSNSLVVTLNASATPTTTQALVRAIGYSSVSDALPFTATNRTVSVTLSDEAGNTSTAATKTISVTGSEDAAIVGSPQLLYDGSLNTTPQAQGWVFPPIGGSATAANGTTNFSTTSNDTIRNGFTRNVASGLNAAAGYTLSFTAQVVSSTPNGTADKDGDGNVDRAGFNLIVVSSDATKAIELSFLTNEIFAQEDGTSQVDPSQQAVAGTPSSYTNTLFTRGEAATFTTTSLINYDLTVSGSLYTLYANGTAILSGRMRNYTAFSGSPDPYEVPNQIFFGDDTTSASGEINLRRVALTTNGIANQTINEDGSTSVAIGLFDPDGISPTVNSVTSGNTTLLPNANIATSGSDSSRTLTLTPAANQFGTATVTLNYNDGAASARAFDLVVNAVNDQPSVTLGSNQTVTAGSTAQTRTNWATFNPGAANESNQTATYTITNNTNPALFAVAPAIDSSGNLTYTPVSTLATATTATISVQVQDSGGTANGGIDTATVQTFTITVKPQPTLSITSVSNNEGNSGTTPSTFTVNLSDTSTQTISVNYATADSTATVADGDYTAASGTLTFAPGETSKTFTVNVNGDTKYETNEVFAVNLANAVNGAIAQGSTSVNGTIGNDDSIPVVNITPTVTHNEGNSGPTPYTFTVSLSNASYQAIAINYTTSDGIATAADGDYTAASGTLTFAPGETSKTITVNANGDTKFETDETFRVLLSTANGSGSVNPGTTTGTATITNDDTQPTLSMGNVSQNEGNSGTTALTFTVTLSNASAQTVAVNYATADGTATTADNDYTAANGTLSFNPGETSKTITVLANGDTRVEQDETFTVNLTTPTNGTIATGTGTGTLANDDYAKVLWRNSSTGENVVWQLNNFTLQTGTVLPTVTDTNWQIASSSADFNRDGIADLLWRNQRTGENVIWALNSTGFQAGYALGNVTDTNWQLASTADFNGDGTPDLLWRNRQTGENVIWQLNQFTLQAAAALGTVATTWQVASTADFNGDGKADILWRNQASGENVIWHMNGFTLQSGTPLGTVADLNWQIGGTGDFNGDGSPDIVWRNQATGENVIWQLQGATLQQGYVLPTLADRNWQLAGVADLGGSRAPEILWRYQPTGQAMLWRFNGFSYTQTANLPAVGAATWTVKPLVVNAIPASQ